MECRRTDEEQRYIRNGLPTVSCYGYENGVAMQILCIWTWSIQRGIRKRIKVARIRIIERQYVDNG